MSNSVVRPARGGDLAAITAIYADAVTNGTASYELEPPRLDAMTARYDSIVAGGFPYLVGEADGRVVGYAYASPFRPRPAYRFVVENSVYVAPDAKGKGVGKALMRVLIVACETLGFRQIIAVIGDGGAESPSVRLHEALGFRQAGSLAASGYKHGRWLDTIYMQLPLNGGGDTHPDPDSWPERQFRKADATR